MGSVERPFPVEPALRDSSFNIPTSSYPSPSTAPVPERPEDLRRIAAHGIDDLNRVLTSRNYSTLYSLLLSSGSYWRDHLGLSNTKFSTLTGAKEIVNFIEENGQRCAIQKFALEENKEPILGNINPAGTVPSIQAFITCETEIAKGRGLVTWVQDVEDGDRWKIFTIFTTLETLKQFPFKTGNERPLYASSNAVDDIKNWKDYRSENLDFKDAEPAVLIVGMSI
jgi:hypothetical protein